MCPYLDVYLSLPSSLCMSDIFLLFLLREEEKKSVKPAQVKTELHASTESGLISLSVREFLSLSLSLQRENAVMKTMAEKEKEGRSINSSLKRANSADPFFISRVKEKKEISATSCVGEGRINERERKKLSLVLISRLFRPGEERRKTLDLKVCAC